MTTRLEKIVEVIHYSSVLVHIFDVDDRSLPRLRVGPHRNALEKLIPFVRSGETLGCDFLTEIPGSSTAPNCLCCWISQ